jgi:hypothetical protein
MVPTKWEESRTGLSALSWFRESEVRFCMVHVDLSRHCLIE